jgi:hypothetical protein
MTVARGEVDSVHSKVVTAVSPGAWWTALSAAQLFKGTLTTALEAEDGLVLAALPEIYLAMVADELAASTPAREGRLRVFTGGSTPTSLATMALPYSTKLDGHGSAWRGTMSNFAARSLRHFVETILPVLPAGSQEEHATAVANQLQDLAAPISIKRATKTDEEIKALIETHWDAGRGVSGRLLRILRDDLLVACEQSRARRLVYEVAQSRAGK